MSKHRVSLLGWNSLITVSGTASGSALGASELGHQWLTASFPFNSLSYTGTGITMGIMCLMLTIPSYAFSVGLHIKTENLRRKEQQQQVPKP